MHESKHQIEVALVPVMKSNGYKKRKLTWHKQSPETILVFYCEKNRWGANRYSFLLGVYFYSLGGELTPPHYRCDVQVDLYTLVSNQEKFRQVVDFDSSFFTADERLTSIIEFVTNYALPWLDKHSTLDTLSNLTIEDYNSLLPRIQMARRTYDYLRGILNATEGKKL
ncbi:MAG: DUF4304 domain-containing protein [Anaerolineales bacterium]